ncbi:molybdopterin-binding protein [Corynebacterium gerontici]|uniref:Bifunctional molybdenum cofactor biosynthesis protein MoaC/MogA n=1 Tax=Corynebacterium gerontici TaxID=2079234 RepID=A0A3G6J5B5_9CORY|nr:molybdopterin-binding protein [Corynebacterium gerontici]AZA11224.1 bifunctional molybdenum cofactor biosynthesis protein MoaC/MogA [Corynebacterium gerontici]
MDAWSAAVIVVSDRILAAQREDRVSPVALDVLRRWGAADVQHCCVAEDEAALRAAIDRLYDSRLRVLVIAGGTGLNPGNCTPEVSLEYVRQRLFGLETQVLLQGLAHTQKAGLSRGVIGLGIVGGSPCLIVNTPSSPGGIKDVLGVIETVWGSIEEALEAHFLQLRQYG